MEYMGLTILFLLILITLGGVYCLNYPGATLFDKIQILGVGFGIYFGILLLLCG